MDDIARLRAHFSDGSLLHPLHDAGTVALGRALAAIAGAQSPPDPAADALRALIGDATHIIFVLVDGLGVNLLERYDEAAFLRAHMVRELRAVQPSSTAPALTSLATGAWPGDHGATGWWTYIPKIDRTVTLLPFIDRFDETPSERLGLRREDAFPLAVTLTGATRNVASLMPRSIAGSVYSRYTGAGHAVIGYRKFTEALSAIAERVRSLRNAPSYTYLYISTVDTAEHEHGDSSGQTRRALAAVSRALERLAAMTGGDARIIVSADHGQMEPAPSAKIVWTRDQPIARMLRFAPSCEPRCPAFHCAPGAQAEFASTFRAAHREHFALLSIDEASEERIFGPDPLPPETRARLGDFVGIALDDSVLLYEPADKLATMVGFHGGMSPDEMRIPLIVI